MGSEDSSFWGMILVIGGGLFFALSPGLLDFWAARRTGKWPITGEVLWEAISLPGFFSKKKGDKS